MHVRPRRPEVAAGVAWSGAGLNLRTSAPTADAVRTAVRRLLTDEVIRAGFARSIRRIGRISRILGEGRRAWPQAAVHFVSGYVVKSPRSSRPILRPDGARGLQQLVSAADIRVDERIRSMNGSVDV